MCGNTGAEKMNKDLERYTVATNMVKYGGGFVSALGKALFLADEENEKIIKMAFPEYWERFLKMPIEEKRQE